MKKHLNGLIPFAYKEDTVSRTIRFKDEYGVEQYSYSTLNSYDRNWCYMVMYLFGIEYHEFERIVGNMGDNDDDEWMKCVNNAYIFFYCNQDLISIHDLRVVNNSEHSNMLGFTLGMDIDAHKKKNDYVGFVYWITLSKRGIEKFYIGQKCFKKGRDWRTYNSSSEHVHKMLEDGWYAHYSILSYHKTQEDLDARENEVILDMWKSIYGREGVVNYSCIVNGNRILKYDYLGPDYNHMQYKKKKYCKNRSY